MFFAIFCGLLYLKRLINVLLGIVSDLCFVGWFVCVAFSLCRFVRVCVDLGVLVWVMLSLFSFVRFIVWVTCNIVRNFLLHDIVITLLMLLMV